MEKDERLLIPTRCLLQDVRLCPAARCQPKHGPLAVSSWGGQIPTSCPWIYRLKDGAGEEGGACLGLNGLNSGGTCVRPRNSKISLLILSRLRVSTFHLRGRLSGHGNRERITVRVFQEEEAQAQGPLRPQSPEATENGYRLFLSPHQTPFAVSTAVSGDDPRVPSEKGPVRDQLSHQDSTLRGQAGQEPGLLLNYVGLNRLSGPSPLLLLPGLHS